MTRAGDKAYETIRGLITEGELAPGDPLGEEALAARCGVSRTPVRDALRRLEMDMLVHRTDTQRSFVAEWSLADIAEMFELRAMLEGHASRRAAERITGPALAALGDRNREIGEIVAGQSVDIARFVEANRAFHAGILEAARSRRLAGLLAMLIELPVIWRTERHYGQRELRRSHHEHGELLAAFARADGAWAEAIMAGHIRRAYHAYVDAHQRHPAIDAAQDAGQKCA